MALRVRSRCSSCPTTVSDNSTHIPSTKSASVSNIIESLCSTDPDSDDSAIQLDETQAESSTESEGAEQDYEAEDEHSKSFTDDSHGVSDVDATGNITASPAELSVIEEREEDSNATTTVSVNGLTDAVRIFRNAPAGMQKDTLSARSVAKQIVPDKLVPVPSWESAQASESGHDDTHHDVSDIEDDIEGRPRGGSNGADLLRMKTSQMRPKSQYEPMAMRTSSPEEPESALERLKSVSTPSVDIVAEEPNDNAQDHDAPKEHTGQRRHKKKESAPTLSMWQMMTPKPIPSAAAKLSKPGRHSSVSELDQSVPSEDLSAKMHGKIDDTKKAFRRPSTFFSSWANKKKKDSKDKAKEGKAHFFIKASFSNSDRCDVCKKPLANTSALSCNSCGVVVHDACKTQVAACTKLKHHKVGSPHRLTPSESLPPGSRPPMVAQKGRADSFHSINLQPGEHSGSTDASQADSSVILRPVVEPVVVPSIARQSNRSSIFAASLASDPRFKKLGIWTEDAEAWSLTVPKEVLKSMHPKDAKRQDIIHELVSTEKHHCRTLVILKQTYQQSLVNKLVDSVMIAKLLPELDELLAIHLDFLENLKTQQMAYPTYVQNMHDVIIHQFSGETGERMQAAYTEFCFQKDDAVKLYHHNNQNNPDFHAAIKEIMHSPAYRDKSLPDCLLRIAQRPTKYHVLVEQLRKNTREETGELAGCQEAEELVKLLLSRIDAGVNRLLLEQQRRNYVKNFDPKSTTKFLDRPFPKEELASQSRRLLYAGVVVRKPPGRKPIEVEMLLFDDLIVFLRKEEKTYFFFTDDDKACVVSLSRLFVREKAARLGSQALFLISSHPRAEMYEVAFSSKKELQRWQQMFQGAIQKYSSASISREAEEAEVSVDTDISQWVPILDELRTAASADHVIADYFQRRIAHYRNLRARLQALPLKGNSEACMRLTSLLQDEYDKSVKEESWPSSEITHYVNLLQFADLVTYVLNQQRSDAVPGSNGVAVKRSETFHGLGDNMRGKKLPSKKHYTITGLNMPDEGVGLSIGSDNSLPRGSSDSIAQQVTSGLDTGPCCKEVTEKLLERLGNLEYEVARLKNENAALAGELCAVKEHSGKGSRGADFTAQLEALRLKESELSAKKREFQLKEQEKNVDYDHREKLLDTKEQRLHQVEQEIEEKWRVLNQAWEEKRLLGLPLAQLHTSPLSPMTGCSPSVVTIAEELVASPPPVLLSPSDSLTSPSSGVIISQSFTISKSPSFSPQSSATPPLGGKTSTTVPDHLAGAAVNEGKGGAPPLQKLPNKLVHGPERKSWRGKDKKMKEPVIGGQQMLPQKLAAPKKK